MSAPLADRIRPQSLDDVVGQEHLLGKDRVLRRMVETGSIPNLIFYGPSGVGKTTVASIIAKLAGKKLYRLNGTTASTSDIREVVAGCDTIDGIGGVILYLDEIQYLNKKQQQTLLEFIENGSITLKTPISTSITRSSPGALSLNLNRSNPRLWNGRFVVPSELRRRASAIRSSWRRA